jgi:predicted transglutaminase-like cysteine proteinase
MKPIKNTIIAASMILTGALSASNAFAATTHMKTTGLTTQPIGHAMFCEQYSQECKIRNKTTKAPKLTRKGWKDLLEINHFANTNVTPVTDQEAYGVEEHWTYPKSYGDCEDYVLLKRYMLMQRGWPASSLLITVVKQPNGEGHAVLTVRTDRADYVLDNLQPLVKQWDETPYQYLKRQSVAHTGRWSKIKDSRAMVANY